MDISILSETTVCLSLGKLPSSVFLAFGVSFLVFILGEVWFRKPGASCMRQTGGEPDRLYQSWTLHWFQIKYIRGYAKLDEILCTSAILGTYWAMIIIIMLSSLHVDYVYIASQKTKAERQLARNIPWPSELYQLDHLNPLQGSSLCFDRDGVCLHQLLGCRLIHWSLLQKGGDQGLFSMFYFLGRRDCWRPEIWWSPNPRNMTPLCIPQMSFRNTANTYVNDISAMHYKVPEHGKYMCHFGLGQHLLSPLFPNAAGCRRSDPLGAAGLGNLDFRRLNTKGDWCKAYEAACSWMVHVSFFRKRAPFWRSMEWSMKKTLIRKKAYNIKHKCILGQAICGNSLSFEVYAQDDLNFSFTWGCHDVMTWNLHCNRSWLDWLDRSWVTTGPVAQL